MNIFWSRFNAGIKPMTISLSRADQGVIILNNNFLSNPWLNCLLGSSSFVGFIQICQYCATNCLKIWHVIAKIVQEFVPKSDMLKNLLPALRKRQFGIAGESKITNQNHDLLLVNVILLAYAGQHIYEPVYERESAGTKAQAVRLTCLTARTSWKEASESKSTDLALKSVSWVRINKA